jgi:hypothetical protein
MPLDRVGSAAQVPLRHEVGVRVVVGERRVLVRPGDAVDAKAAVGVVVPERAPETGSLHQDLQAVLALKLGVLCGARVADDGVGDVCVDVEGSGARRPVAGALLAADGAPGEGGAAQAQLPRSLPGQGQDGVPPAQGGGGGVGRRVGEHREYEHLGVPEDVAVVAGPGQALGRDGAILRPGRGLEDVEEGEADCLLQLLVTLDHDVGRLPELVQILPLTAEQLLPAAVPGRRQGSLHLIPQ